MFFAVERGPGADLSFVVDLGRIVSGVDAPAADGPRLEDRAREALLVLGTAAAPDRVGRGNPGSAGGAGALTLRWKSEG